MTTDEPRQSADRHAAPDTPTGEPGLDGSPRTAFVWPGPGADITAAPAAQPQTDWSSVARPLAPTGGDVPSDGPTAGGVSHVHERHATVAAVTVQPTKSVGIALLLTFLFGPFGMFYSTVSGAIFMVGVLVVGGIVMGIITFGLAWIVWFPLVWFTSIIWGSMAAANRSNAPVIRTSLTVDN